MVDDTKEPLHEGVVKSFYSARGYGFIRGPEGDVFVHYTDIKTSTPGLRNLVQGERVMFALERDGQRLRARACFPLEPGEARQVMLKNKRGPSGKQQRLAAKRASKLTDAGLVAHDTGVIDAYLRGEDLPGAPKRQP
jgi:cold shock CspA family protein